MELLHFRGILRAFFLLQLLLLPLVSSEDNLLQYFINCGSPNPLLKVDDRDFVGDETSNHFSVGNSRTIRIHKLSSPETIYETARFYQNPSSFEVIIEENGTYLVRFHFFPFISSEGTDLSKGLFNISARRFLLFSSFSVENGSSFPVIKEYFLDISPGKFQIDFVPERTSFAFVNAIELIRLPTNFTFHHANYTDALQTVYRVNVGGQNVNDSGALWRTWEQDDDYIVSNGNSEKRSSTFDLNEDPGGIDYIAPYSVYESCRLVNSTGSSITNLTWQFPVKSNAKHFVRLHFSDFLSFSKSIYLIFNVFVNSDLLGGLEPSNYVKGSAAPFFCDLVVDSDNSGYLKISIAPRNDSEEKIAFLNGLEIMAFVSNTSFELPPYKEKHHPPFVVIESVCSSVALVFILMVAFLIGLRCRKFKPGKAFLAKSDGSYWKGKSHSWISENPGHASRVTNFNLKLKMPLSEILAATRNFDTDLLIGEGGFGKVYKGTLQGGIEVAVKRSDFNNGQGVYEFQTEVVVLSKIRHRHLVSLIGYCHEGNEMILVYEFMGKGSLRDHLYNWKSNSKANKQSDLTWKERLEICIGAAKGLHYLHTGSDGGIIHRDVKSTNILLDEEYVAKVADFGLSRSGPSDADHYSTNVKGSFGYLDPEYFKTYQLTDKSDVYSFGVVLLEVLCARQPIVNSTQREEINLAEWGMHWLNKGQPETIMDPLLVNQINLNSLKKFSQIIEKCLKPEGADRPSMLDVCWDLEYALQLQKTPVNREPNEDSTTYVSSNIALPIENLDSEIFKFHEGSMVSESNKDADLSAIDVFSSHNIDGAR